MKILKEYLLKDNELYTIMNEDSLYNIAKGKHIETGFCIVSACRDTIGIKKLIKEHDARIPDWAEELDSKLSDGFTVTKEDENILNDTIISHINNYRTKLLKTDLKNSGYSYMQVLGAYKEEGQDTVAGEISFIVFPYLKNVNKSFDDMQKYVLELGKEFEQDSILVHEPGTEESYYKDCTTGEVTMKFTSTKLNDTAQEYFTSLKNDFNKENSHRFSFVESYIHTAGNIMHAHQLDSCHELFYFSRRKR